MDRAAAPPASAFITRWKKASGSELANAQLFVTELCELLALPRPEPASDDVRDNAYVFERRVQLKHGDGSESEGRIDCYRRAAFVLESKKIKAGVATKGFDEALLRARSQAEGYARALPAGEGRPPFLIVVDVGHVIELYSEFSRSGATYTPFPDPRSHRIRLDDLAREDLRERLRQVWLAPDALDPAKISAQVTREVAAELAVIARALEAARHPPELVAGFLTRCLFTFFAEDVGLLPAKAFAKLLAELAKAPEQFVPLVGELWQAMDSGRFSAAIRAEVKRFNGKLFKQPAQGELVLPLNREQIERLHKCATRKWNEVEPAIIGTLLERALDPRERHKLGAHYTPRAYVERLVLPTVIEPLRADWAIAQAAALTLLKEGKAKEAEGHLRRFHHALCSVRVLDPACGSGNFLYVTLEHLKRLEGEVLNQLAGFSGGDQVEIDLDARRAVASLGMTVDPHQLLGIELNPKAAAMAELVLWIGYLQWHFRTRGHAEPPLPVLKDYGNIECRDAVLAYDAVDFVVDQHGVPVTRWDGRTMKPHPVTGEDVPDEAARMPLERYVNPRQAAWPAADFVVGNPPFIGASTLRRALGDGYVEALRQVWDAVPESADFVMVWWHHAAKLTQRGALRQFGFITTNSLRQTFNRRVVEAALAATDHPSPAIGLLRTGLGQSSVGPTALPQGERALSLVFAIPDHPWVDSTDGAAVRIAMTVAARDAGMGRLNEVIDEQEAADESIAVTLRERLGQINPDLSLGANLTASRSLIANSGLSYRGVTLMGSGFWVSPGDPLVTAEPAALKPLRNGKDIVDSPRGCYAIDFFGLNLEEARSQFPQSFQRVVDCVRPERMQSQRASYREKWWQFAEARPDLRKAIEDLPRYIATAMTAKHRTFVFVKSGVLPDQGLIAIGQRDAMTFGVLSSRVHVLWSLSSGGKLGVGNDPRYNNSRCFDPFPFPTATPDQQARIAKLAEAIDAHRKRQQAAHEDVTLTGIYNVLERLRTLSLAKSLTPTPLPGGEGLDAATTSASAAPPLASPPGRGRRGAPGEGLSPKERSLHEHGLVSVLASLHDELDTCVLEAYGWSDLAPALVGKPGGTLPLDDPDEAQAAAQAELLTRLVALNAERASEEARGLVRWLRPEFQNPLGVKASTSEQIEADLGNVLTPGRSPGGRGEKRPWPGELPAQVRAVADVLAAARGPLSIEQIAACFNGRGTWKVRLPQLLETLTAIGQARVTDAGYLAAR